jgi:rod shape-determining protein MreD
MSLEPAVLSRLVVLGVVGVILQTTAVSQVTVFGAPVDLFPLVVATVGLLLGSIGGAAFGFAAGLFLDLALLQAVGVTSLVYTVVGYGAGRLLELRDPAHGLTPMVVGAAATATATVGFAMLTFMIGFDAPVSFLLVRQILVTIVVNTLLAVPVYAVIRRFLDPHLARDPRRRRRRASTTRLSPLSRA